MENGPKPPNERESIDPKWKTDERRDQRQRSRNNLIVFAVVICVAFILVFVATRIDPEDLSLDKILGALFK